MNDPNKGAKIWRTKEWEETRKRLIKDYREQCKATDGPFVLQHTRTPFSYQENYFTVYRNFFIDIVASLMNNKSLQK